MSYIRQILEYASIVLDNCTLHDKESLENLQYEAASTVNGLKRSLSIERLLTEIGCIFFSGRRKMHKLILVYKEKCGFLADLFLPTIQEINPSDLRINLN